MGHIVSAFDKDLADLNSHLKALGKSAQLQLEAAVAICESGADGEIDNIIAADKRLDALELELNEKAVELIARRAPMAQDLRRVIAALKVAAALERIGDYAKNIAKRMRVILASDAAARAPQIAALGREVSAALGAVMEAYRNVDAEAALIIRDKDEEIDKQHTKIFRDLLAGLDEEAGDNAIALHFIFIAKNTERMGDYVTAIAEQVYFLKNGVLPDDDRPKADKSSST